MFQPVGVLTAQRHVVVGVLHHADDDLEIILRQALPSQALEGEPEVVDPLLVRYRQADLASSQGSPRLVCGCAGHRRGAAGSRRDGPLGSSAGARARRADKGTGVKAALFRGRIP